MLLTKCCEPLVLLYPGHRQMLSQIKFPYLTRIAHSLVYRTRVMYVGNPVAGAVYWV